MTAAAVRMSAGLPYSSRAMVVIVAGWWRRTVSETDSSPSSVRSILNRENAARIAAAERSLGAIWPVAHNRTTKATSAGSGRTRAGTTHHFRGVPPEVEAAVMPGYDPGEYGLCDEPLVEVPAGLLGRAVELLNRPGHYLIDATVRALINRYPHPALDIVRWFCDGLGATSTSSDLQDLQDLLDTAGIVVDPTPAHHRHRG